MWRQLSLPERALDLQQRHLLGTHQRDPGIDDGVARLFGRLLDPFLDPFLGHDRILVIDAVACNLTTRCDRILSMRSHGDWPPAGGRCAGAMRAAEAGAPVLLNSNEAIMDTLFI